jgi:thiamine monophosphate synthase
VALPVLAIGGVALHNIETVARAGAGVASIGLFIPSGAVDLETHVSTVVQAVRRTFDSSGIVSYH